jgi:hypothetical protein
MAALAFPEAYWRTHQHAVDSLPSFFDAVRQISAYQQTTGSKFVWRGVANAAHPLYSSIVRHYIDIHGEVPSEKLLRAFERSVFAEAQEWNLDWHREGGRLTALELLAAMQHHGIATRLLDFTLNPLFALWFATEKHDDKPGRVFAIDISDRLAEREWASKPKPWWWEETDKAASKWTARSWIWRPPPFEPRIVRQGGVFLVGGVPTTTPVRNVRIPGNRRPMRADEVRASMSVSFQLISYQQAEAAYSGESLAGNPPKARAFTLLIEDKQVIREELERTFDLSHKTLFPDFPGMAAYGRSFR